MEKSLGPPNNQLTQQASFPGRFGWRVALQVWLGGAGLYSSIDLGFWALTGATLFYKPFLIPEDYVGILSEPLLMAIFVIESLILCLLFVGALSALKLGETRTARLRVHRIGFLIWLGFFLIYTTRAQPYLIDKAPSLFFLFRYGILLPAASFIGAGLVLPLMSFADERRNNLHFALLILMLSGLSILALHSRLVLFWPMSDVAKLAGIFVASLLGVGIIGSAALGWASKWPGPRLQRLGSWGLWMLSALSLAGAIYAMVIVVPKAQERAAAKALESQIQHFNIVDQTEKGIAYFTIDQETREALLATPQREYRLAFEVSRPTSFHVGFGARLLGPGEGRVTFELVAGSGASETVLVRETISVSNGTGTWYDRLVDLRQWAGKEVSLRFRIIPLSAQKHLSAAWSTPYPAIPAASVSSRPHVILISLDTLRADHLSSWGYGRLTSPNLDALAEQGTRFSNHWSTSPWTLPSHMSMLTGRYGINHLMGFSNTADDRLDQAIPTLAEILKEHGYVTVAFTGGGWVSPEWFKRGFLRFRISREGSQYNMHGDLKENLEALRGLLDSHESERLFLFFHTYRPHTPYLGRFFIQGENIPTTSKDSLYPYNNLVVAKALYDGNIKITDEYIGLLSQLFEEKGILRSAIVVVTSDHGEAFGEHGQRFHGKTLFDEELHIPLILLYPGRVPKGRTVGSLTRGVDVVPTILDLLGLPPPATLDGKSLLPVVEGRSDDNRTVLIDVAKGSDHVRAKGLRTSSYKLIGFTTSDDGTLKLDASRSTLYDLKADPEEQVNRLAELSDVAIRLSEPLLKAFLTQGRNIAASRGKRKGQDISKERLKQLKALGYMQ